MIVFSNDRSGYLALVKMRDRLGPGDVEVSKEVPTGPSPNNYQAMDSYSSDYIIPYHNTVVSMFFAIPCCRAQASRSPGNSKQNHLFFAKAMAAFAVLPLLAAFWGITGAVRPGAHGSQGEGGVLWITRASRGV